MARYILGIAGIISFLLFSSCSESKVYFKVLEGNYAFSRGDYMTSNLDYIQAGREGRFLPWIYYNLGNVYHSLGEADAALDEWKRAEESEDRELLFKIAFNRGVVFYERGEYENAFSSFRRALRFSPDDLETKVNMEYTLRKQAMADSDGTPQTSENGEKPEASSESMRILEYVERSAPTRLEPESSPLEEEEVRNW
ncbi:MAG: tetratricopeptide repeat protein [Spirochaetaceae bacterium]